MQQFMSTHTVLSWASAHAWVLAVQAANNGGRAVALRRCFKEWMISLQNAPIQSCVNHCLTHALFSAKRDKLSSKKKLNIIGKELTHILIAKPQQHLSVVAIWAKCNRQHIICMAWCMWAFAAGCCGHGAHQEHSSFQAYFQFYGGVFFFLNTHFVRLPTKLLNFERWAMYVSSTTICKIFCTVT